MCIYIFLTILSVFAKMTVRKLINERNFLLIVGLSISFCRFHAPRKLTCDRTFFSYQHEKWRRAAKLGCKKN